MQYIVNGITKIFSFQRYVRRSQTHFSILGLAWVSGMCHPRYSCTINEGKNFESVYVIAHEMGHK